MTCELCDHTIDGGGSGEYLTRQVRLMVEPMLMNKSGPPRISVIGSEIEIERVCVTVTINKFRRVVSVMKAFCLLGTEFMVLHLRNALEGVLVEQYNNRNVGDWYG